MKEEDWETKQFNEPYVYSRYSPHRQATETAELDDTRGVINAKDGDYFMCDICREFISADPYEAVSHLMNDEYGGDFGIIVTVGSNGVVIDTQTEEGLYVRTKNVFDRKGLKLNPMAMNSEALADMVLDAETNDGF